MAIVAGSDVKLSALSYALQKQYLQPPIPTHMHPHTRTHLALLQLLEESVNLARRFQRPQVPPHVSLQPPRRQLERPQHYVSFSSLRSASRHPQRSRHTHDTSTSKGRWPERPEHESAEAQKGTKRRTKRGHEPVLSTPPNQIHEKQNKKGTP